MKLFTLTDYPKGTQSELLINFRKFTRSLGILGFLGIFLISAGAYSQVLIKGAVPVQTPLGGFAVDGDAIAGTPADYIEVGDWFFKNLGDPANADPGGIFRKVGVDLIPVYDYTYFLQDDIPMGNIKDATIFTTAAKIDQDPNTYTWGSGSSPPKNEIQNVAAHFTYGDPDMIDSYGNPGNPDDLWVLFAADRSVTNGDSYIDFEFLQAGLTMTGVGTPSGGFSSDGPDGGRTVGDLLVTVGYGNGGGVATVAILRWESDGSGGYYYALQNLSDYQGMIYATTNTAITYVPFDAYGKDYYEPNQWVEGAVNLSGIFDANEDPCISLSTLFVRTRSSGESGTAQLKDFPIGPIQLHIDLTPPAPEVADVENCGPWEGTLEAAGCEGTVSWYAGEFDEMPLFQGASYDPGEITETTSFWVSCTVEGCEGPRAEVTVTIFDVPELEDATDEFCEEDQTNTILADYNDDIGAMEEDVVVWYSDPARSIIIEDTGDLAVGEHTFYATVTNGDDCSADAELVITIYANPDLTDATDEFCDEDQSDT
ncbi:MAG TPA: hypothetical protein VLN72_10170, partial [Gillisia sp.]|nr:hypothetical protein [Gillisia sp.]